MKSSYFQFYEQFEIFATLIDSIFQFFYFSCYNDLINASINDCEFMFVMKNEVDRWLAKEKERDYQMVILSCKTNKTKTTITTSA